MNAFTWAVVALVAAMAACGEDVSDWSVDVRHDIMSNDSSVAAFTKAVESRGVHLPGNVPVLLFACNEGRNKVLMVDWGEVVHSDEHDGRVRAGGREAVETRLGAISSANASVIGLHHMFNIGLDSVFAVEATDILGDVKTAAFSTRGSEPAINRVHAACGG